MSDMDEPIYARNYVLEMRRIIDAETAEGPYTSANVASHIVRKLTETDKELLIGWLMLQAKDVLRATINRRDSSIRTHAIRTANRTAFGKAAKEFSEGDPEALGTFLAVVHVTADGLRKRLTEMTAKDLKFVASSYSKRANANAMQAAFLGALAKRLDSDQQVKDVFDEQRLSQMWLSISDTPSDSGRNGTRGVRTRSSRTSRTGNLTDKAFDEPGDE